MPRLSMNEMTTYRWSFEEDVRQYQAAGIAAIGVWRQKLEDFGDERGIELLRDAGLAVSNVLWAGGFTGSNGHTHQESIDDALEAIELAAALGSGCLIVYSGSRAGHTTNHARRLLVSALKALAPRAERCGVKLALEPMHPQCAGEWTFLSCLDETLSVLDQVNSPQVQLAFDTYHLGWSAETRERIPSIAARTAIVHLGDGRPPVDNEQDRTRLGEGELPLGEIVSAFSAAGYDGDYDVELLGEAIERSCYQELIRHSQAAFQSLLQQAFPGRATVVAG